MDKIIDICDVSKSYGSNLVLNNINLYIKENEFVTLLGPSGCGKTTLLKMLGGFEKPNDGNIIFNGKDISDVKPNMRNINTVFQSYALFPHLNVYENVAFGPKNKKLDKAEIDKRVKSALKLVKLEGFEKRSISQLSGGQKQRVAIARAVVNKPKVLLLDEPLSALDLKLRQDMQYELKDLQKTLGITFVFVTHDQEEALTMSDTIVVMNDGIIQQIGTPEDIYNEPKNRFVASFIGESNIVRGIMKEDCLVEFCGVEFECVDKGFKTNEIVDVVVRPEDFYVSPAASGQIVGTVSDITFKGVHYEIILDVCGIEFVVHSLKPAEVESQVGLVVHPSDIHIMRACNETV